MHGREGHEHRKLGRHMWSVPSTTTTTIIGVVDSNGSSDSCFIKDGRKISVGDCALFKPAKDSPPFVGIIRCWTSEKESNLRLRVNWLYRPSEVKLSKGVALEAAPNEVFYSFHSDEIPVASLLHPCKVAFLPKGVELPLGISSFVCRRVYDITNKCLWWLTDQDYIDDRQDEVDKLLQKTRIEMHASLEHQQDSRSPKPVNGSTASPLKHSPDSVQNSSSNLPSHRKGKKRDRGDQSFDVSKRERSSKLDDVDSGQSNSESALNFEIAKFSEKGGLVDSESVSRLVRLMQPEKSEKKIDLTSRCMLAGVIAATDKFDCLNQFVQLRGILILNEWLQEVHKGKINDSGNVKNSDKSVDDFLLVLLRALDKLPVNLNALQMCNIGKSVNHLRSHKNSEIQKKARSLVDTWKKRVEVEMSIGETERSQHESSHGGSSRHPSGSDAAIRSPLTHHSSLKSTSVKHPVGARSALSPTSTSDHCKDGQTRFAANGGSSDPQNIVKEEKSSSSSQSHTNSQCSSEQQAKHIIPGGKEDTRRSTAGSKGLNKTVGTTKHRKSTNGPSSGIHRETVTIKSSSMVKNSGAEKLSQSSVDANSVLESNNQKIIVKIGNRSRGPAQSVGNSLEDSSCRNSGDSSPPFFEKHDQSDVSVRGGNKHDPQQILEADGSSLNQSAIETKRLSNVSNVSKIGCSPSRTEIKSRKVHDSSFSSMNALIESCAKISEENVSISAVDDVGMNLLASVAAGEISKSGNVSPDGSPRRSSKVDENSGVDRVVDQKQLLGDEVTQRGRPSEVSDTGNHVANISKADKAELKNNGTLVEKVDTSMSVSDPGSETVKEKVKATEKSQNESLNASQKDDGSLGAQDNVKAPSVKKEIESKAKRDNTTCPTNDDEKPSVDNLPQRSDVVLDQNAPVVVQSDPVNTIEKSSIVSCSTSKHPASEISNEVKSEKTEAGIVENCPPPEKQVKSEGSQNLENKESGPPDLGPKDSHSNTETSKSHVVEEESKEKSGPTTEKVVVSPSGVQDVDSKLGFDLNEGFDVDEGKNTDPINLPGGLVSSVSCGLPASVTIAAPAKGPFVPPDDLLWNKRELGWKGSAATSAFRPAEPRKSTEVHLGPTNTFLPDPPNKPSRLPLDIDLNVADESSCQDLTTSSPRGGLDLDLNKVDEASDMAHVGRHMSSGKRDFDLNDGPAIEDLPVEQIPSIQPNRAHIPFQQPLGPRINTSDIGNCFPWYPSGTSYSLSVTPSVLPDREPFSIVGMGGGPQRVMGGPTSALSFNPDAYRGSLLSSSPAMPFHSTPFQYPVLPFGTSFPLPTSAMAGGTPGYVDPTTGGRISAIPSQLVGNPTAVSFQYPQAYVVSRSSLPEIGNTSVVESSHKWGKQGLDLNSGPGILDVEGRDETLGSMSRQVANIGSQSNVEEQARMYSMGGGNLKRKEPEGGWNIDQFNFKQSSWR